MWASAQEPNCDEGSAVRNKNHQLCSVRTIKLVLMKHNMILAVYCYFAYRVCPCSLNQYQNADCTRWSSSYPFLTISIILSTLCSLFSNVIWIHSESVHTSYCGFLGYDTALQSGRWVPMLQRNKLPPSSGQKMKVVITQKFIIGIFTAVKAQCYYFYYIQRKQNRSNVSTPLIMLRKTLWTIVWWVLQCL